MLKTTELKLKGKNSIGKITDYLNTSSEYYRQDGDSVLPKARWWGQGPELFGLNDANRDEQKDLACLLQGFNPNSPKTQIVKNAGTSNRRLGWDLTFSAEKPFSILFASATPQEWSKMLEIHHQAVNQSLDYIQENLTTRAGKAGTRAVGVSGLFVRQVDHLDSRNGDAQLHTHNVVVNASMDAEGAIRCLEAKTFFQIEKSAGAVYRHAMASGFQSLGYGVVREREQKQGYETGEVWTRINGIDKKTERIFSTRRQEIEAEMSKSGIDADKASLLTRKSKGKDNEAGAIVVNTLEKISQLHKQNQLDWKVGDELKGRPGQELQQKSSAEMLERLHATNSHFSKFNLIEVLAQELPLGTNPVKEAKSLFNRALESGEIIQLREDKQSNARYCTKAQWDLEEAIGNAGLARKDEIDIRLSSEIVKNAINEHEKAQGFELSEEQKRAVEFVAMETGGVALLSGKAGTGKTATAGAYIKAFEASGFKVYGTSTSQSATENLQAEGQIESYNTTALLNRLDEGKIALDNRSVIILDEAGMVGAKTFSRIQKHIDDAGGKLVAVGDALQLQPIEAGSPFRALIHGLGDTQLSEIRRQRHQAERSVAEDFYSGASGLSIIEGWTKNGQLQQGSRKNALIDKLVNDYTQDSRDDRDKLVIAQTRKDKDSLNLAIRTELKSQGKLGDKATVAKVETRDGEREIELSVGDRLRFEKNRSNLGIANGDIATVVGWSKSKTDAIELKVRLESGIPGKDGREVVIDLSKYNQLDYGYARTLHSSQGLGKEQVYWLATSGENLDRNMGLVAFTRTKDQFNAYATNQAVEAMKSNLDKWGTKETAKEMTQSVLSQAVAQSSAVTEKSDLKDKRKTFESSFKDHVENIRDRINEDIFTLAERSLEYHKRKVNFAEDREQSQELKSSIERQEHKNSGYTSSRAKAGLFDFAKKRELDGKISTCSTKIVEQKTKQKDLLKHLETESKEMEKGKEEELARGEEVKKLEEVRRGLGDQRQLTELKRKFANENYEGKGYQQYLYDGECLRSPGQKFESRRSERAQGEAQSRASQEALLRWEAMQEAMQEPQSYSKPSQASVQSQDKPRRDRGMSM